MSSTTTPSTVQSPDTAPLEGTPAAGAGGAAAGEVPVVPLWINGQKAASTGTRSGPVTNPASGQVIRTVPFSNATDVDAAVKAASAAFPAWRDTPP